ncbi:DUF503 domain-containing protein [Romboutsia lituseburensis]|uniref:DUF503 domain-containing protein n=1 Tax=Romboutsia lituseburensis TaxID=1537 RepID=UPI00215AFCA7|nr:DUF503 domain-containing protein [Romboutsia lituseburensis]MCR8745150.1 DUF503 domain-containing protein [Romboutsia lituseburensis]
MKIFILKIKLRANWVHSLKEKRMIVKSIVKKLQNTFNISVSEVENQDIHQMITIGISGITLSSSQSDSIKEKIINFIEDNSEAIIIEIEEDIINY